MYFNAKCVYAVVMAKTPFSDSSFLWEQSIRVIWDHWSNFGFSQRNAPLMSACELGDVRITTLVPSVLFFHSLDLLKLYSFAKNWFICSSISSLCSVIDTLPVAQTSSAHFLVLFVKENTSLQLVLSAKDSSSNCVCFLAVKRRFRVRWEC